MTSEVHHVADTRSHFRDYFYSSIIPIVNIKRKTVLRDSHHFDVSLKFYFH